MLPISPAMMPLPTPTQRRAIAENALRLKIKAKLPTWRIDRIYLSQGRWHGCNAGVSVFSICEALETQRLIAVPTPAWRQGISPQTAEAVVQMCRRLLAGNPNSQFVQEQYPELFAELTAEAPHRKNENVA